MIYSDNIFNYILKQNTSDSRALYITDKDLFENRIEIPVRYCSKQFIEELVEWMRDCCRSAFILRFESYFNGIGPNEIFLQIAMTSDNDYAMAKIKFSDVIQYD